ncbi:MAG TPA: type 2 isopentenyl-diphosphate Delta-isomerase [Chloroflexota bacterium]|nr:type 2 isopentenyl-diphosphate Delta-isomerase [Chloroflexota bacterium]
MSESLVSSSPHPLISSTEVRKEAHLRLAMDGPVQEAVRDGFAAYRLEHNALPELDLEEIDLATTFLGKRLRAPLLISGMTGGAQRAREVNRNLAAAAQQCGIAFSVGSQRAALERPDLRATYEVRDLAPDILLFANLGAVQLRRGYGLDQCRAAVTMIGADALTLHLNALQEALQAQGDTTFAGVTARIADTCRDLGHSVTVKEVGWGISGEVARRLEAAGVSAIDVQGAGGTSWARVEGLRAPTDRLRAAAEAFASWGIPTPECIVQVRTVCPGMPLIAGGGVRNGVDVAKAVALGADLVSVAHPFLEPATRSVAAVVDRIEQFTFELRLAMFATGSANLRALRGVALHLQGR